MKTRNTKQKEVILSTLKEDSSHPTIEQLYQKVKLKEPTLGKATIYRNVNKLVEEHKIKRLTSLNDSFRYDGKICDHYHLKCIKCGKLLDVFDDEISIWQAKIMEKNDIQILYSTIFFEGVCGECKLKEE